MKVEMLVLGNISKEEAQSLATMVLDALQVKSLQASQGNETRIISLRKNCLHVYATPTLNPTDPNSATVLSYQIGQATVQNQSYTELLAQIVREPCFTQLRTKEQLGYLIWSGSQNHSGVLFFSLMVQSGDRHSHFLCDRMDFFVKTFLPDYIKSLSDEDFNKNKKALIKTKEEKEKEKNIKSRNCSSLA